MPAPSRKVVHPAVAALATLGSLVLTGCGMGSAAPGPVSASAFHGTVYGGAQPITGATVTLYSTGATGYGSAGTLLGTATTGADGAFTFSGAQSCSSPKQEYVTVQGGNPGAGTNNNYLLMAALGNCGDINTNTNIFVDELTTVAAAYSLGNFINITGNAGAVTVNVGAPANAAVATGSCSNAANGAVNTISSCQTAGLVHAFQNALNLVSGVNLPGSAVAPTGQAYSVPPSNPAGEVPQAEIDTLGNVVVGCVNSASTTNSSGANVPSTGCSQLFTYTTPSGGTTPTNTLQAMMNLAKNPTLNTAQIYALPGSITTTPYSPSLAAAPTDFSLAVVYNGASVAGLTTQFVYPYSLALDANDNVYVAASDEQAAKPFATRSGIAGLNENGTTMYAPTNSTTYVAPTNYMATDNNGYVWVTYGGAAAGNTSGTTPGVVRFTASTGGSLTAYNTSGTYSSGIAIDKQNNIWFGTSSANVSNLNELVASTSYALATLTTPPSYSFGPYGVGIGKNQNIWTADGYSKGTKVGLFPNNGTVSAPTYTAAGFETAAGGNVQYGSVAMDSASNAWVGITSGSTNKANLIEVTPSAATGATTATVAGPVTTAAAAPEALAIDGSNYVWMADYTSVSSKTLGQIATYNPTGGATYGLNPCRAPGGMTTCQTGAVPSTSAAPNPNTNGLTYAVTALQVDSSGDIWAVSQGSGVLFEIIGTASPTWPLLAYGVPGTMPN